MHFDIETFNYEGTDNYGVHMLTEDITYTVLFLLYDDYTVIYTFIDLDDGDSTIHYHKSKDAIDAPK